MRAAAAVPTINHCGRCIIRPVVLYIRKSFLADNVENVGTYLSTHKSQNTTMIHAETKRLILRDLAREDLPRLVEMIGDWDVVRWLASVPYPYRLKDAEEFYGRMQAVVSKGMREYFLLEHRNGEQIGAIGLRPPREPRSQPSESVMGYWLGKDYWA